MASIQLSISIIDETNDGQCVTTNLLTEQLKFQNKIKKSAEGDTWYFSLLSFPLCVWQISHSRYSTICDSTFDQVYTFG